jgi:hypothetical protein
VGGLVVGSNMSSYAFGDSFAVRPKAKIKLQGNKTKLYFVDQMITGTLFEKCELHHTLLLLQLMTYSQPRGSPL